MVLPHIQPTKRLPFLRQKFGQRVLSLRMEKEWFPLSPDHNLLDFLFPLGSLDNIYKEHPRSEPDLKAAVEAYVQIVTIKTYRNVIEKFTIRVNACRVCACVWGCSHRTPQL